jgi:PAS domain S-box-containing protein
MASNNFLEAVMDTVLDGLIIINQSGIIQRFNASACKIFGYTENEVLGKNVKILMPEPYQSSHDGYLHNYHTTGDKKIIGIGREILAQRKDGSIFPMELGVNDMEMNNEKLFVGTIRDISERKQTEKEIHQTLQKLKISNQELDQFAYIASHDLKEPLRGLANNALFLKEDYEEQLDEDGLKRISRIRFLCSRMEMLVDNLLYYSRLGRHELALVETDLNTTLEKVIELSFNKDTGAQAEFIIPEPLPKQFCDHQKVAELFRNLISNGIKYNDKPHKTIEIGITQKHNPMNQVKENRVFYVKDNGIGIDEQFFSDIFRIFKRLNSENDAVRGSGVGLTFVKKIVERHEGTIWLESEPDNGSCFYFTLNLEPENE